MRQPFRAPHSFYPYNPVEAGQLDLAHRSKSEILRQVSDGMRSYRNNQDVLAVLAKANERRSADTDVVLSRNRHAVQ